MSVADTTSTLVPFMCWPAELAKWHYFTSCSYCMAAVVQLLVELYVISYSRKNWHPPKHVHEKLKKRRLVQLFLWQIAAVTMIVATISHSKMTSTLILHLRNNQLSQQFLLLEAICQHRLHRFIVQLCHRQWRIYLFTLCRTMDHHIHFRWFICVYTCACDNFSINYIYI